MGRIIEGPHGPQLAPLPEAELHLVEDALREIIVARDKLRRGVAEATVQEEDRPDRPRGVPLSVWRDTFGIGHAAAQRLRDGAWPSDRVLDQIADALGYKYDDG